MTNVYSKKYLLLKILLENVSKYSLSGIYRPQAYLAEAGGYCTECQIELIKTSLEPGENCVIKAVLFAPHGFGEHLKTGVILTLKNGLDTEAKALVLEIKQ